MPGPIISRRDSTTIFGFLYAALHVTIVRLKLWHGLAVAAIAVMSVYNIVGLELVYSELREKVRPVLPLINIALQVIPFIAVGLIWTLRKLLDGQIDILGDRIREVQDSTGTLTTAASTTSTAIGTASKSMIADTQTAANGLSTSATVAAADVATAADSMSRAATEVADKANAAADRVRDEAELAHAKLAQQSDRLRNEIERLSDELETKSDQILARLIGTALGQGVPGTSSREKEVAIAADAAAIEYWEKIRSAWRDTRDDMATVIAHIFDHEDGRRTRNLKFDFRNYGGVARKLEDAGYITAEARQAIEQMDGIFNRLKRKSSKTTGEDVTTFESWRHRFREATRDRRDDANGNGK